MIKVKVVWLRNIITDRLECLVRDSDKHKAMLLELYNIQGDGASNVYEEVTVE